MNERQISIFESQFVPKQAKLTEDDKRKLLETYSIGLKHLPRIRQEDSVVKILNAKRGDVVRSTRVSPITGIQYYYYRVVV